MKSPSTYEQAVQSCQEQHRGIVAMGEDQTNLSYLNNLFPDYRAEDVYHSFFIGLTKTERNSTDWVWSDGTPLVRDPSNPWKCRNGDCLQPSTPLCTIGQVKPLYDRDAYGYWTPIDCQAIYPYVCEIRPCDSVNYCA